MYLLSKMVCSLPCAVLYVMYINTLYILVLSPNYILGYPDELCLGETTFTDEGCIETIPVWIFTGFK